jgi:hypothetical protein
MHRAAFAPIANQSVIAPGLTWGATSAAVEPVGERDGCRFGWRLRLAGQPSRRTNGERWATRWGSEATGGRLPGEVRLNESPPHGGKSHAGRLGEGPQIFAQILGSGWHVAPGRLVATGFDVVVRQVDFRIG